MPFQIVGDNNWFKEVNNNPSEDELIAYMERLWAEYSLAKTVKEKLYPSKKRKKVDAKTE